jgi:muramidase (phage lysozyme)
MANVIDALVVSLGLDPADFIAKSASARADMQKTAAVGRKAAGDTETNFERASEASIKHSKELESWGKAAAESLGKLRDSALGLFAVFTAGKALDDFAKDTTVAEAATGRLAKNLAIPVQTLSEWQQVMQGIGGTAEDANSSLQGMQGLLAGGAFGNLDAQRTINILGIDGERENASQALVTASQFFASHSGAIDQQIASQAGISQSMMNFLEQGPAAVQKALSAAAPTAITAGQVQHAQDLQAAWAKLDNTLTAIGRTILDDLDPHLQTFLGWLQKIADWGLKHPEQFGAATAAASVLSGAAGASILRKLAQSILGRGGANAPKEAEEAAKAAEVIEAGGSVALSPALAAALGIYATNALGEPGIDPNESAELRRLYPNAPRGTTATVDRTLPPVAQTFLNSIASGESGGDYSRKYGNNPDFTSFADHPRQEFQTGVDANGNPINTSAAGRYQFEAGTWDQAAKALGLTDFSPANQDKAAWWLAQQNYRSRTGRDLLADLQTHDPKTDALIQQSLAATWTSLKARSPSDFASSLNDTTPPPAPPAAAALAGPINALKRLTGQDKSASSHTGEYQSGLTGQWSKMPPITYEPPLPQGLVDALNQMKAPAPTAATAALIARHGAMASSAASARHISTTNHGPVNSHNTSNAETHVHSVVVNTKATNADGITRSMKDALKKNGILLMNTNTGLA